MNRPINFRTILLACLIISVGQLSMGLVMPSLPWIAKDFSVSLDQAQLLVSIYLLGFGPSQFIYGPMSDALGRKKVLLAGLLIAMSGLLMIIFWSHTFTGMVLGRFLQGLGTGCCAVLARASTRDQFSGNELPVAMSYIAMAASITPLIAPVIGGFINFHFGWSMVFISLLGYVSLAWIIIAFRFKETITRRSAIPSPAKMLVQYRDLLSSRYFMSFASISWLNFSLMITTVSVMPFIMQDQIGMTSDEYAMWALIPALGMLGGTTICNRIRPLSETENVALHACFAYQCGTVVVFLPGRTLVFDDWTIVDDSWQWHCVALCTSTCDATIQRTSGRGGSHVWRRSNGGLFLGEYDAGATWIE